MDEKVILQQVLDAHRLLRHDFLNNLQVITGYQQLGQVEKANEYIFKTVAFLRGFSVLEKLESPLLKGLLLSQLTKCREAVGITFRIENPSAFSTAEESELLELLSELLEGLKGILAGTVLSCQICLGGQENNLMSLVLTGPEELLRQTRQSLASLLNNSGHSGEILQKGNTIQVKILPGSQPGREQI